ncbi:MAG: hypothetical protein ACK5MD_03840 [Flavobacteriales bacterium]
MGTWLPLIDKTKRKIKKSSWYSCFNEAIKKEITTMQGLREDVNYGEATFAGVNKSGNVPNMLNYNGMWVIIDKDCFTIF